MSTAAGDAKVRAPLPLSVALGFEDAAFLDRLAEVAGASDGPLARDLAEAVAEAARFRMALIAGLARNGRPPGP